VVEEVERRVAYARVDPQAHLAQFYRHGIQVHRVDAVRQHIAPGGLQRRLGGILVARAQARQFCRQHIVRFDEEVPAARCGVADLELQQRGFGGGALRRVQT